MVTTCDQRRYHQNLLGCFPDLFIAVFVIFVRVAQEKIAILLEEVVLII